MQLYLHAWFTYRFLIYTQMHQHKRVQYFRGCINLSPRRPNVCTGVEAAHTKTHLRFFLRFIRRTICRLVRLPQCLGKASFGPSFPEVIMTVNPFTPERSKTWWVIEHNPKPQEYSPMTGYFIYYGTLPFISWCYTAYCVLATFCIAASRTFLR